jgi:hypothetical protein
MNESWYDTAQICTNGHVTNSASISSPQHNKKFCDKCGAPTITNCQNCNACIQGHYHAPDLWLYSYKRPSFCHNCGKPYPWTEASLKAAQELSDELDSLSPEERSMLKKSLDEIVWDTPGTTVAATRFKKLIAKAGQVAANGFRDILVDVLSEATKKIIWPS